jgi:hypothetical protein
MQRCCMSHTQASRLLAHVAQLLATLHAVPLHFSYLPVDRCSTGSCWMPAMVLHTCTQQLSALHVSARVHFMVCLQSSFEHDLEHVCCSYNGRYCCGSEGYPRSDAHVVTNHRRPACGAVALPPGTAGMPTGMLAQTAARRTKRGSSLQRCQHILQTAVCTYTVLRMLLI